jgi:hypothetical protein
MSSTLNLFPARVPIGTIRLPNKPDGTQGDELKTYASMEFLKALKILFDRVGGANGTGNGELAELITQLLMAEDPIPPAYEYVEPMPDHGPMVANLSRQVEEMQSMREASQLAAEVSALRQQVEQLALLVAAPSPVPNYSDFLQAYAAPQVGVDWEHPGKIGARTANSGAFTTLSASGQISSTIATGTAPLVVASVTKVSNLNADLLDGADWTAPGPIGATTPASAAFTTVTASDQIKATKTFGSAPALRANSTAVNDAATFAATNSDSSSFLVGYSGSSADPSPAIWWTAGTVLRLATATNTQAAGFTQRASIDANGLVVVAGFGCNGKPSQPAYALGAAATDLASVLVLANNLRTMSINIGTGS